MYLRKCFNKKTGRTQLSIVQGYRDALGKPRQKVIRPLGYLDVLEKEYDDPISHFTEVAKQLTDEYNDSNSPVSIEINPAASLVPGTDNRRNLGYAALAFVYHELGIDAFFQNRQRQHKIKYNLNSIFRFLVYSRLLSPASRKASFESRGKFFERMDFSLDDVYRSLSVFVKYNNDLMRWIHEHITQSYGRNTSLVYYDVTNYYFETDRTTDMKKRGVSKEHRHDPIIQMGLFMDTNGLPISYGLFPGNTSDSLTLIPMIDKLKEDFNLERTIYVGDRGMITGDNINEILQDHDGYVLSFSIRGADKEFKNYVLDEKDYVSGKNGFKKKSRTYPRMIWVTDPVTQKKKQKAVDEKHVVFYSPDYAGKAKMERAEVVARSMDLISNPDKYSRATSYGAAKYVKNIKYDKKTGKIQESVGHKLELDDKLIAEEEKYDGYYAIVTSEYKETDGKIIDIYRGLWRIEETFRITKSDLETRPVYLSLEDHIRSHFLICFVALVIARVLEYKMEHKYNASVIIDSLRKCNCSLFEQNMYLFDYYDDVLKDVGEELNIDFSRKYRALKEVKKILGDAKKQEK